MKRTTLLAALTGAAVLLAGCGSTSGTATAGSTTGSSSSSSSAAAPPVSSPAEAASSAAAPATGGASASVAPSSAASGGGSSVSESSASSSSDIGSSQVPTTTIGDTSGGLDAPSAAWFSTFCGGFGPVLDIAGSASSLGSAASDPAKGQKLVVDLYTKLGKAFTDTAASLKNEAPPTFSGGEAFAAKVVTALGTAGPQFTKAGNTLAALDVSKDPTAFTTALTGLSTSMQTALQPLQDLGSLKLTAQTQAAFEALPACAKLKALSGG